MRCGKYAGAGQHQETQNAADVCIIGAGASGLSSALRLRQKSYKDIVIFERNAGPGDKAVTRQVEPNNTTIHIAALLGKLSGLRLEFTAGNTAVSRRQKI
jgi:glycine/D-amino acid oxidase-like deaminating enzyme